MENTSSVNYQSELEFEWKSILESANRIFIFGTKEVAKRLYALVDYENMLCKFEGFLVSEKAMETEEELNLYGFSVKPVNDNLDVFGSTILVSLTQAYHPEVFNLLSNFENADIIEAHRFFNIEIRKEIQNQINYDEWIDDKQLSNALSVDEVLLRKSIIELYSQNEQAFGNYFFYQSLPALGLKGDRPTDYRFKTYKIEEFTSGDSDVLDIGSNCGFFDIFVSEKVNSIMGIEYNEELVKIAKLTAEGMKKNNVSFCSGDYKEWQKKNTKTFDVVFSFAVHVWLGVTPTDYASQIYELLNTNGFLFFESQTMPNDKMYYEFCNQFIKIGMKKIYEGSLIDDGINPREFCILKK